jgi:hypothetical protein
MQMGNRYNHDRIAIQTVDQSEGKTGKQTSSQARLYFRARQRISNESTNGTIRFVEKLESQTWRLFVILGDSVVKFGLGRYEKAYLHGRRYFSITAS